MWRGCGGRGDYSHAPTLPRMELGSPAGDSCVCRALAHVLSVASRLPVASRKYELVRGLAERLLDDNVRARGRAGRTGMGWWRPAASSSLEDGFSGPAVEKLTAER